MQPQTNDREWLKAAILFGLAFYFAFNIVTGNLSNYVNARFDWLSYVAVGLFAWMGAASVYAILRGDARPGASYHSGTPSWGMLALVGLPLVMGTLIPSQPLGVDAAADSGVSLSAASYGGSVAAALERDPLDRNILEWLRVFNSAGAPASFDGDRADVIGFVYREPTFNDDQFMVARFTMSCCVADASALGLPVTYAGAAELESGAWVQVTGRMQVGDFGEDLMPIVQLDNITVVEQPEHPYLYP